MSATSNTDVTRQTAGCTGGDAVSDQRADNQGNDDQALSEHATVGLSDNATLARKNDYHHPAPGAVENKDSVWEADCEDGKRYCLCNGVSSGAMIYCDGNNCEKEWPGLSTSFIGIALA
ncbi:hypothetical protein C8Q74DRAFT_1364275 [Fomes fomentarius]|nr:hypothetical protein C8Q74DRAFT_1364275 [Fomes fomentarius]